VKEKIEYLLKYISNDTFNKILNNKGDYILDKVIVNRIDVDLNIRYLKKYGVYDIDKVVYERLEELTLNHNDFIKKINDYEKKLTHEEVIMILENV